MRRIVCVDALPQVLNLATQSGQRGNGLVA
jgi:hypothetical protein